MEPRLYPQELRIGYSDIIKLHSHWCVRGILHIFADRTDATWISRQHISHDDNSLCSTALVGVH